MSGYRPITLIVMVSLEARGDADLGHIARAFEQRQPLIPFAAGETLVHPRRLFVERSDEQPQEDRT